jgi:hypothetical protein
MLNLELLLKSFEESCKEFNKEKNQRVIVVVEGIDTCPDSLYVRLHQGAETLLLRFASLYREGLIHVLYIASDFRVFDLVRQGNSIFYIVMS